MSYTRRYPAGVPALQLITPGDFEYWDTSISTAVDGTGGGVYSGALEFTNCDLTGTSSVDITGTIATTSSVTGDAGLFDTVEATTSVEAPTVSYVDAIGIRVIAERFVPVAIGTQTIDTSTATVLALDFTLYDTWEITLNDGAGTGTATPAVLATVATLVDTSGTANLQVKQGSKISITFKAGSTQTGGIGISPSVAVFPASFHGLTKADLVGPRSGANGVGGGTNDWMRIELENIGTFGTPRYSCSVTMGSG